MRYAGTSKNDWEHHKRPLWGECEDPDHDHLFCITRSETEIRWCQTCPQVITTTSVREGIIVSKEEEVVLLLKHGGDFIPFKVWVYE